MTNTLTVINTIFGDRVETKLDRCTITVDGVTMDVDVLMGGYFNCDSNFKGNYWYTYAAMDGKIYQLLWDLDGYDPSDEGLFDKLDYDKPDCMEAVSWYEIVTDEEED